MTVATELGSLPVFAGIPTDELSALAAELTPVRARVGEVLMRQGEKATSFFIIASGEVEVRHTDSDGTTLVAFVSEGLLGEIALLRNAPRTATVVATDEVHGYLGHEAAFERLLEIPGIATQLVRTARQRVAAFLTPIPFEARDGTELMLRPVLPGDIQRAAHGQMMFSPETLYRRFLSVKPTVLTYLFEVDYVDHFVWVVTDGADGPVIAGARFVRDHNDPTLAEIASTVADAYQGRGIGAVLFSALAVAARVDGVTKFQAQVLSDNLPARALLDRLDAPWIREEPGVASATIEVPDPDKLPIKIKNLKEVQNVAQHVIRAFE
jgi:RimJ/RimL family protein N-acetyltransferase